MCTYLSSLGFFPLLIFYNSSFFKGRLSFFFQNKTAISYFLNAEYILILFILRRDNYFRKVCLPVGGGEEKRREGGRKGEKEEGT